MPAQQKRRPNIYREPDFAAVAEFQEVFGFVPTNDDIPFLAELGLTLRHIGGLLGCSFQNVEDLLKSRGLLRRRREQHKQVVQAQQESVRKHQKALETICTQINHHLHKKAGLESLAAQRALAYVEQRTCSLSYEFEHIVTLFDRYQHWVERSLQITSYSALVKGLPFTGPTGRKMILALGLPLPSYTLDYFTTGEKAALQRVYDYRDFTITDIAYFMRRFHGTVHKHYYEQYPPREGHGKYFLKQDKGYRKLTYHLASEIYSGQDAHIPMPLEDIATVLDTSIELVQYAVDHKEEIAPVIIEGLRLLTGTDISRSYLLEEDRDRIRGETG